MVAASHENTETLGHQIRRLRLERGWSQAEMARRSGISRSQIWKVECGRIRSLQSHTIARYAEALSVSRSYIFLGVDVPDAGDEREQRTAQVCYGDRATEDLTARNQNRRKPIYAISGTVKGDEHYGEIERRVAHTT